jgi:hypothetical protein
MLNMTKDSVTKIVEKGLYFADPAEQFEAVKAITSWAMDIYKDEKVYTPEVAWKVFLYFMNMTDTNTVEKLVPADSILKDMTVKDFMFLWFAIAGRGDLLVMDTMDKGFLMQTELVKEYKAKGIVSIYDLMFEHWNVLGDMGDEKMGALRNMQTM